MQDIRDLNSQCKVVVFPWLTSSVEFGNSDLPTSVLSATSAIDISKYLMSASFSKSLAAPSGSFSLTLPNTHAWNEVLEPGYWLMMWMTQDGDLDIGTTGVVPVNGEFFPAGTPDNNKKLRCVGIVDRLSINYVTGENGERDITWQVSGRDFGAVYEETTVWQNQFIGEKKLQDSLKSRLNVESTQTLTDLISVIHDLFLFPPSLDGFDEGKALTEIGLQWLLPAIMVTQFLGMDLDKKSQGSYFGNIKGVKKFDKSSLSVPVLNPLNFIKGEAWGVLKASSMQQMHELYPELDNNGELKLNFRMIPWSMDVTSYPKLALNARKYKTLVDDAESSIELNGGDVYSFNLGQDNHSRFNHFLTLLLTQNFKFESNVTLLQKAAGLSGRKYPYLIKSSVKRYGFRDQHTEINNPVMAQLSNKFGEKVDPFIIQDINEFMYDIWSSSHMFESGTASIIGTDGIRVGKVLKFNDETDYLRNKAFYIEAYTDTFLVDDNGTASWDQEITLTRGIDQNALKSLSLAGLNPVSKLPSLPGPRNKILRDNKQPFTDTDEFLDED